MCFNTLDWPAEDLMRRSLLDRLALIFAILAVIIFLLAWGYVVKHPYLPLM